MCNINPVRIAEEEGEEKRGMAWIGLKIGGERRTEKRGEQEWETKEEEEDTCGQSGLGLGLVLVVVLVLVLGLGLGMCKHVHCPTTSVS